LFGAPPAAQGAEALRSYTLVLEEPPAGERLPRGLRAPNGRVPPGSAELRNLTRQVRQAQEPVRSAVERLGAEVAGGAYRTLNAVFVRATRAQAKELERVPGVARVVRGQKVRMLLNAAGDVVGAPRAWNELGGVNEAGEGVRIAVIDSGIDHEHPALQDDSLQVPDGFPKGRPEDIEFTSNKIIAARSYVNLLNPDDPASSRPDDETPRDRVGHGTSIAVTAAGRPVDSPVGTLTGVAPKAFLGNYKIFGAPDINEFNDAAVIAAIDDAVADGMEVIIVGFGAVARFPYDATGAECFPDAGVICDPMAQAAQSAVEDFGVVVVAAAGNAGDFGEQAAPALNSMATPATAPSVIAVGATLNSRQLVQSVEFAGRSATALSGTGPEPSSPLTAEAVDAGSVGDRQGCSPFNSGSLRGRIVVIARGGCQAEFKVEFADEAGAVGVVLTDVEGFEQPFVTPGLETTDIPSFMIGFSDGEDLRARLPEQVTLDPSFTSRSFLPDEMWPRSSRGPTPRINIKPDLVAPGAFIFSGAQDLDPNGDTFDPTGFDSVNGTSFAAPLAGGAAALVMQRHPLFSAAQVKSALVNTANPQVFEGEFIARATSAGGGLLDIPRAIEPPATAEPALISFGEVSQANFPITRQLIITNTSGIMAGFDLFIEEFDSGGFNQILINGGPAEQVQLGPGDSRAFEIQLTGPAPSPGTFEAAVRVRGAGGEIHVPLYYVVGDGEPFNSFAISGTGVVGTVNEPHPELLIFKVIDRQGVPVGGLDVEFRVTAGGGSIFEADATTDPFGVAAADVDMGPEPGFQDFEAEAGGLAVPFFNEARRKPEIGNIVNGASFDPQTPVAPGSIVSVFGSFLSEFTGAVGRLPLPVALKHVSVSFDFPEEDLSVPGRLFFASPQQVNVQVPWEFAGLNFVLVKVRIEDSVSQLFELPLADWAPGIFEFPSDGTRFGVVTHPGGSVVTPDNPARPGDAVTVWATGLGPVDEPQRTGRAAPPDSLVRTTSGPAVSVDGQGAAIQFSGLAPGFVGLYQVNVTIPQGARAGNRPLVLEINGAESNTVTIPIG